MCRYVGKCGRRDAANTFETMNFILIVGLSVTGMKGPGREVYFLTEISYL